MFIRGQANGASIELSGADGLGIAPGSETYHVTFRENGIEAGIGVYAFEPNDNSLPRFFAELAEQWKAWEGVKKWSSLEGEFEITCEHDGLGHIGTTAKIHSNQHGNGWTAELRFDFAAGELDGIAGEVKRFFAARV